MIQMNYVYHPDIKVIPMHIPSIKKVISQTDMQFLT